MTRQIFQKHDDPILTYLTDDGQSVEPEFYVPIIPMVLVNGAEGIGTGWSTNIPNYNPKDVVKNVKHLLNGEELEPMHPWYRGFKVRTFCFFSADVSSQGKIELDTKAKVPGTYKVTGVWEKIGENTLKITELPIGTWTQTYKEFLEKLIAGEKEKKGESSAGEPLIKVRNAS